MSIGRSLLLAAAKSQFLNRQSSQRAFVKRAVKKFMPGETPEEALHAGQLLADSGRGIVFTKLGENLSLLTEATAVRDHYLWLFDQIKQTKLPAQVSVKPTQLGLDLAPDQCTAHVMALAKKAEETGSTLWLDMEDSSYVDRTLDLYAAVRARHPRTGLAIQAYLYRTPADIERLLPLNPIIRLVKGAYAEPANVAFPKKSDTDAAYYEIGSRMLTAAAKGSCLPIFGTHDLALIDRLSTRARELGVADGKYEVHMLYGIRDAEQLRLVKAGRTVKTLVSYGPAWFKWYMRRLAERPANVWFVVRTMLG